MRLHNPLNQHMIDIWDSAIMLIEDRYNQWVKWLYDTAGTVQEKPAERQFIMEFTNMRDCFRSLSWHIFRLAVLNPERSDRVADIYDGIAEDIRLLMETQRKQESYDALDLFKQIISEADNLEDSHDLLDFSFMLYQLYYICKWLLLFENMNPDRIRVSMDLEVLSGLTNQPSKLLNAKVSNTFLLKPQLASRRAHELTEMEQWNNTLPGLAEELNTEGRFPPPAFNWMAFWLPMNH